ncbi:glycosyltransferase family 29 protein [Streptomyces sp. NPDC056600]|uniref:glycosyltransferase family 29 protein n=1 Tax=Streptomyces sp. NPDC056600 TaxID=3345874 RepID=UPI0036B57C16
MTAVEERRPGTRGAGQLEDCLAACAVHSGKLVGSVDRRRGELAEELRKLLALWSMRPAGQAAPQGASGAAAVLKRVVKGGSAGTRLTNDVLDALIAVADKALRCDYDDERRLAELIADTVLGLRENSRAGWRLRARVTEARGDEPAAVAAYTRFLELTSNDGTGIAAKVTGLRTAADRERDLLDLLGRTRPGAQTLAARRSATELWAEGLELRARGARDEAEDLLVAALLAHASSGAPVPDRQRLLAGYVDLRVEDARTGGDPRGTGALTELAALWSEQHRTRRRGPVADPAMGGVTWLSLGEFRNTIAGRSVCLVANSGRAGSSGLGREIDDYDLVVRFNSYRIDPAHTGSRTDIHATIHKHGFNWDKPVTTRLVFGGLSHEWKYSLRNRLVPGAQEYLGDESLRWPLRNIGKAGPEEWPAIPTTGFNMLWLLDFLDVNPVIDLIGFDFYESGAYRVDAAMKLPITTVHEYTSEKDWVLARARRVTDTRISLR